MQRDNYVIAGVLLVVALVGAIVGVNVAKAPAPSSTSVVEHLGSAFATNIRSFPSQADVSTTTRQHLNSTTQAKSSFIVPVEDVDLFDLNMIAEASSTAAKLVWDVSFSYNYDQTTGNGDWYCADAKSVTTATTTHTTGPLCHEHEWTPGTVATSTKNVAIEPVASKFARVRLFAKTADISLHADAILRKPLAR